MQNREVYLVSRRGPSTPPPHQIRSNPASQHRDCREQMSHAAEQPVLWPLLGTDGHTWKLTNGAGGMRLWVPAVGKKAKSHNPPADLLQRTSWAATIIGTSTDDVPASLIKELVRGSGAESHHPPSLHAHRLPASVWQVPCSCCHCLWPHVTRVQAPQARPTSVALVTYHLRLLQVRI